MSKFDNALKAQPGTDKPWRVTIDCNPGVASTFDGETYQSRPHIARDGRVAGAVVLSLCPPPPMPDGRRLALFETTVGRCTCTVTIGIPADVTDDDRFVAEARAHLQSVVEGTRRRVEAKLKATGARYRAPINADEDELLKGP